MNGALPVELTHGVGSMKLVPPHGFPETQPPSYGIVTQGAVALVEVESPDVQRSFASPRRLPRSMLSARNDVTLVAEAEIQPFALGADGRSGVFNEGRLFGASAQRLDRARERSDVIEG